MSVLQVIQHGHLEMARDNDGIIRLYVAGWRPHENAFLGQDAPGRALRSADVLPHIAGAVQQYNPPVLGQEANPNERRQSTEPTANPILSQLRLWQVTQQPARLWRVTPYSIRGP